MIVESTNLVHETSFSQGKDRVQVSIAKGLSKMADTLPSIKGENASYRIINSYVTIAHV